MVVQASAALIAAVAFLVTVRQTLSPPRGNRFLKTAAGTMILFVVAIAVTVFEDLIPSEWHFEKWATWAFFVAGLLALVFLICRLSAETYGAKNTESPKTPVGDRVQEPPGSEQSQNPKPEKGVYDSSYGEKERLRATLVLGLMASIIGAKLIDPSASVFKWVPTAFNVLLLYWGIYAGATVYGIFGDFSDRWSRRLVDFGHLSFKFVLVAAAVILIGVCNEWLGVWLVLRWSLSAVGALTVVFLFVGETRGLLRKGKHIDYARKRLELWIELAILISFLFLADYLLSGGSM